MEKKLVQLREDQKRLVTLGNGNMVWEYKCDYCEGWKRHRFVSTDYPNPACNGTFCSAFCSSNHRSVINGTPLLVKSGKKQRSY